MLAHGAIAKDPLDAVQRPPLPRESFLEPLDVERDVPASDLDILGVTLRKGVGRVAPSSRSEIVYFVAMTIRLARLAERRYSRRAAVADTVQT